MAAQAVTEQEASLRAVRAWLLAGVLAGELDADEARRRFDATLSALSGAAHEALTSAADAPSVPRRKEQGMSKRTVLATAGAAFAFAAGAGGALADRGPGPRGPGGRGGGRADAAAIASYLGLTQAELRAQLRSGKTLAQVAQAQGKSVSGLEDAIYGAAKRRLDAAVDAGRLTAAQEQTMLAGLKSHLDEIVNHTGPLPGAHRGPPFAAAAAKYLGLTDAQLRTQLQSGKSLGQIATADGKSVAGLKAAILADSKTHLDQEVAAGRLTAAQAKQRLDELSAHLDDLVNRTGPPPRGHR